MDIQSTLSDRKIIQSDPEIMSGAMVFVGSRVPLQTFFDYLEAENGLAEFMDDFPYLHSQVMQMLEIIAQSVLNQKSYAHTT